MEKEGKTLLKGGVNRLVILVALILGLLIVGYGCMHISYKTGKDTGKDYTVGEEGFKTPTPTPTLLQETTPPAVIEDQPTKERKRTDIYLSYAETAINCWADNAQAVKDIDREIVILAQKEEERRQKGLPPNSYDGRNERIDELIAQMFELCL